MRSLRALFVARVPRFRLLFESLLIVACAALAVGMGRYIWLRVNPGVSITLQNVGMASLDNVVVHLVDRAYPCGNIAPDGAVTVSVRSRSATGVEVEFADISGVRKRLNARGYLEPAIAYRGEMLIRLNSERIVEVQDHIIYGAR
jgi:hypothetical protein